MEAVLKANRPELKESSIKNYMSNLKSLYRSVFGDDKYTLSNFNNTEPILDFVHQKPVASQHSSLAYLFVLTGNPVYQQEMKRVKVLVNEHVNAREPPAEENMTSAEEIQEVFEKLKKRSSQIYKKKEFTKETLLELQNTILVALMSNLYIPPRRSLDYEQMLLHGKDDSKNYIDGNELVFNVYKTAKHYGQQRVKMPPPLKKMIDNYRKVSPYEYLFTGAFGKPLHSITPRLTELFGHPVGVNSMRRNSTQQFNEFADQHPKVKEHMKLMGSSVGELNHYCR
jgi:hypothetical protein